ncbi:hypothetical protein [Halapricum sp. CBA1109]|uniref:hypothetical protein n=1 Tax=Halapricum sp. CBA1109 TaxID=2668068 RepID=UPI0012F8018E|nr:hypothetical protein [Halapricum sp. CBA1109]
MSGPLQFGIPGGPELTIILFFSLLLFVVPIVAAVQIYRDASANDVDNPTAWSLGMLLVGLVGNIVGIVAVWILYTVVEIRE